MRSEEAKVPAKCKTVIPCQFWLLFCFIILFASLLRMNLINPLLLALKSHCVVLLRAWPLWTYFYG